MLFSLHAREGASTRMYIPGAMGDPFLRLFKTQAGFGGSPLILHL